MFGPPHTPVVLARATAVECLLRLPSQLPLGIREAVAIASKRAARQNGLVIVTSSMVVVPFLGLRQAPVCPWHPGSCTTRSASPQVPRYRRRFAAPDA